MRRVLVIDGHPDPEPHFIHALADAYVAGARSGGHQLRRVDVGGLDFPILRSPRDWMEGEPPEVIAAAQEDMRWAEHVVILFPLWLGDMPALLKGLLEQMARPGFALAYRDKGFPEKLLKGRSAHVVVTMGMPALAYTLYYRAHGLRNLERNILGFVGFKPVTRDIIGTVEASADTRAKWLRRMEERGRKGR